jgi:cytochrome c oxidase subunit I
MSKIIAKQPTNQGITKKWLFLSLISLALAGVLTIIIVLSRVPAINDILSLSGFFKTALVIHVDLSQICWMLTILCLISVYYKLQFSNVAKLSLYLAYIAVFLIFCSSFASNSVASLNNYIPVLDNNILFALGLAIFFTSILLHAFATLNYKIKFLENPPTDNIIYCANITLILAFIIFLLTHQILLPQTNETNFFEILFWGFGHILQLLYIYLMLFAWIKICTKLNISLLISTKHTNYLILLHLLIALSSIIFFAKGENLDLSTYKSLFTAQMAYGASIVSSIFTFIIIYSIFKKYPKGRTAEDNILKYSLFLSIILFNYGGIISLFIKDSNTIIPAHYHGSTVGVTVALMGYIYLLLPKLNYGRITKQIFSYQPLIYAFGQIMHITGLAISGGYGALRKSPDAALSMKAQFWMGIMGFGGLLAMIGGLYFLIICLYSINKKS